MVFEIFENPKIYCFEPDPRVVERFKIKVGQHANVFEIALYDQNGEIDFYQKPGTKRDRMQLTTITKTTKIRGVILSIMISKVELR